jgi:GNAT superfamily N-acetyltransferase
MAARLAVPADAEAIAALHLESWRSAYRPFLPARVLDELDLTSHSAEWRRRVGVPEVQIVLEEEGGKLVGFCAHGPTGDPEASVAPRVWEIKNLHVHPERKGTGSGSRLFDAAVQHARAIGAGSVTLWVVEGNSIARAFYERKGMVTDGGRTVHTLGADGTMPVVRYRLTLGT